VVEVLASDLAQVVGVITSARINRSIYVVATLSAEHGLAAIPALWRVWLQNKYDNHLSSEPKEIEGRCGH
jgi:hypothetical protein